jgi:NAD(P)-dependent dehydrogenase (short-subunit alcohol dehydrogenase family)
MTRYLAVEYGPYGVRINTVSPGLISNNDSEYASDSLDASLYSKYANLVPLRRSGSPDEVADLALFLALSSSSFITGQNIVIDGGLSLREQIGVL